MSKLLNYKLIFFILCFTVTFYSVSKSSDRSNKFRIENWVENIPILPSLIQNKRDVVEFDSSNGKIISISFYSKRLLKKHIFSFYNDFFREKKWEKDKNKNVWETKSDRFKKKILIVENTEDNILIFKIIIENF